ncbi:MAG: hypothetical protein KDE25_06195 [Novosphingobium sp.]|nr:hypothetical protein [Novosphingobium sp.]
MRFAAILAAAALVSHPVMAQSEANSCLTPKQAGSLAGYALPSVITGATKRCATALPEKSYLRTDGSALAKRYATRKDETWPAAKAAFLTMSKSKDGTDKFLSQLPDSSLREMVDVVLEGMIVQEIAVNDCGKIDNIVRLLAPLPPGNTAELVVLLVGMAPESKAEKPSKLSICKS